MPKPKRKKRAVRVLERTAQQLIQLACSRTSDNHKARKLAASLEADLAELKQLTAGEEEKYSKKFQAVIVKLVKLTRKLLR